ncbi:MAG: TetR/AcrR family transcriptional regulator [Deltaproteobacteria bacterium]|nr:TetR/AcrR family transcriptional regulator [Deltaproteobacteria bacterium]
MLETESAAPDKASDRMLEKRAIIRNAAYRCFARNGYHRTSVDDVCRAAKISKGSYYWHYETKQAVFLDILDHWASLVENELALQFRDALASPNPFTAMTQALGNEAKKQRRLLPVWMDFLGQVSREPEIRSGLATFHRRIRETLTTLLRPMLTPAVAESDLRALTGSMLACFVGLVCQDLVDPDEAGFNTQIRIFMNTLERLVQQARVGHLRGIAQSENA